MNPLPSAQCVQRPGRRTHLGHKVPGWLVLPRPLLRRQSKVGSYLQVRRNPVPNPGIAPSLGHRAPGVHNADRGYRWNALRNRRNQNPLSHRLLRWFLWWQRFPTEWSNRWCQRAYWRAQMNRHQPAARALWWHPLPEMAMRAACRCRE